MHLVGAEGPGANLGCPDIHRLVGEAVRDLASAHDHRGSALVWRAEHELPQRVVQHRRGHDLVDRDLFAPERIRVQGAVAEVLVGHPRQRLLGNAVLVEIMVGLDTKELGGDELPVLRVPLRQRQLGGVVGEGATRVLVQADGYADVVLAQPDGVGGLLDGTGRGGTGVEHVGERDTGEPDQPGDRIGVGYLVATAEAELDVFPLDTGVGRARAGSRRRPSPSLSCRSGRMDEVPPR